MGGRMIVVLDNARYRHAVLPRSVLRQRAKRLRLLFPPPYSLLLASIERAWKLARRLVIHNRHFPTLGDIVRAVHTCFDRWRWPNRALRRLCCIT